MSGGTVSEMRLWKDDSLARMKREKQPERERKKKTKGHRKRGERR
jgi:hypothetical protein